MPEGGLGRDRGRDLGKEQGKGPVEASGGFTASSQERCVV